MRKLIWVPSSCALCWRPRRCSLLKRRYRLNHLARRFADPVHDPRGHAARRPAVSVTDKDGKLIEGLTADDFTLTEDNVPQTISVFEFQKLDDT